MMLNAAFMFSDSAGPAGAEKPIQGFYPRRNRLLEKFSHNGKAGKEECRPRENKTLLISMRAYKKFVMNGISAFPKWNEKPDWETA